METIFLLNNRVGSDEISNLLIENSAVLSAVLTAMLNHRLDPGVQQYGCCVISNLAIGGEAIKRKLKKSGVHDVSLTTINRTYIRKMI